MDSHLGNRSWKKIVITTLINSACLLHSLMVFFKCVEGHQAISCCGMMSIIVTVKDGHHHVSDIQHAAAVRRVKSPEGGQWLFSFGFLVGDCT